MSKYCVVDASGKLLYPLPPKPPLPKRGVMKREPSPPSLQSLSKLEDAIFEDGAVKRIKFLNIYKDIERDDNEKFDVYLMKHESRKRRALVHCWSKLGWRPNLSGTKVVENNPYL